MPILMNYSESSAVIMRSVFAALGPIIHVCLAYLSICLRFFATASLSRHAIYSCRKASQTKSTVVENCPKKSHSTIYISNAMQISQDLGIIVGNTLFHVACKEGQFDVVELILRHFQRFLTTVMQNIFRHLFQHLLSSNSKSSKNSSMKITIKWEISFRSRRGSIFC